MGALLWLTTDLMPSDAHGLARFVVLGLQIGGGIAVYGLLLQFLGAASWREAVNALKRPA
jgi:putative peptidoglycan lipid II flippase